MTPEQITNLIDQIQSVLDSATPGFFNIRDLMWAVIEDVQDSYARALDASNGLVSPGRVVDTVDSYLANYYGDD